MFLSSFSGLSFQWLCWQTKYTTKCVITTPIMSGKEPVGVIMALNKQGAEELSKSDQEVSGLTYF